LLVTIDTLRADHVGCYGCAHDTTPVLDSLAREGVLFEGANAHRGLTWPSLASIHTGTYPVTHGVHDNQTLLSAAQPSLATVLAAQGYACAAFLGYAEKQRWEGFPHMMGGRQYSDEALTDNALAWLREYHQGDRQQPFFLWIHYFAPHVPFAPKPPYASRYDADPDLSLGTIENTYKIFFTREVLAPERLDKLLALYDGEIRYTDDQLARLLNALDEMGLRAGTLTVITSDHGEELCGHHCYIGHWGSPYAGVHHVPLVFHHPGHLPKGKRVSDIVQSIDIAPTILDALGVPCPERFEGANLTPLWQGQSLSLPPAVAEYGSMKAVVIRKGDYRFINNPSAPTYNVVPDSVCEGFAKQGLAGDRRFPLEPTGLYHIPTDAEEQANLAADRPEIVAEMMQVSAAWEQRFKWSWQGEVAPPPPSMDTEQREDLKALGYL